jgi:hypothetical protein
MWRSLILIIIVVFFTISLNHAQNFKIDLIPLKSNLTFDSLSSKNNEILITIFYKNFGKTDCEKSKIVEFSNKDCSINSFREKLILTLNKSSFMTPVRIKIFYWSNASNNTYFIEDEYNRKTFNNKMFLEIEDQMAFIDFSNYKDLVNIDVLTNDLNKIAKTHLLNENFKIQSIFEFTKTLKKKGVAPFKCPSDIRALYKDSVTMFSSNTCPSASIPLDDMFLEHLALLFRPHQVLNFLNKKLIINQEENRRTIKILSDSLNYLSDKISAFNRNQRKKSNLAFGFDFSLFIIEGNNENIFDLKNKVNSFTNYSISYSQPISNKFSLNLGMSNSSFSGIVNTENISHQFDEFLTNGLLLTRNVRIRNFEEKWSVNNMVKINIGVSFSAKVTDRISFIIGLDYGRYFLGHLSTFFQNGIFDYRASIDGVNDELANISSLNLKDNIVYNHEFNSKLLFHGKQLGLNSQIRFQILNNINLLANFQLNYILLINDNFNQDSLISSRIGDFNSSLHGLKSLSFLPMNIGIGFGINF